MTCTNLRSKLRLTVITLATDKRHVPALPVHGSQALAAPQDLGLCREALGIETHSLPAVPEEILFTRKACLADRRGSEMVRGDS